MTWKRVATAAVLIPIVLGLVLLASTAWVAIALAFITVLALWEYFALGDAIGHRAYRFWTLASALAVIYLQWLAAVNPAYQLAGGLSLQRQMSRFVTAPEGVQGAFILFLIGVTVLTLWTRRPLVEALPAAGISSSAILLGGFPLSFAVRLHGLGQDGRWLLLFALVITWANDTVAYFVGRAIGKHPLAPGLSPKKTWEGSIAGLLASLLVGWIFSRWLNVPVPH